MSLNSPLARSCGALCQVRHTKAPRVTRSMLAAVAAVGLLNACGGGYESTTPTAAPEAEWKLVWADEFDGTTVDATKWGYDVGTGSDGWGNQELQYYTAGDNVKVEGGNLTIEARKESVGGMGYTSARLLTKGKAEWTYGRIEARIKMPYGNGTWAAFWMLGANIDTVSWPACGEIDIVEFWGGTPIADTAKYLPGFDYDAVAVGSLHWPSVRNLGQGDYVRQLYQSPGGAKFRDDFHVFAIEWTETSIKYFVDGTVYQVLDLNSREIAPDGYGDVHKKPYFMLLNLAIGGGPAGSPDATTVWPQRMMVDWVRVYQR